MSDLRVLRNECIEQARAIVATAEAEIRTMSEDEVRHYDELMVKIDSINADIERQERVNALDSQLRDAVNYRALKPQPGALEMSPGETRQYSILRAIRAAAKSNWQDAGLEREVSDALAKRLGKDPQGFFMPTSFGGEMRDLTTDSAFGGKAVATDLLSMNFIDLLRNKMILRAAGATVLGDLVGNVAIPRLSSGATAYWVSEGSAPTESTGAIDQVTMSPKTVGAWTDVSRKLLLQASIDVEMMVRSDLATVLAIELDRVGLHGSGEGSEPTGVDGTSGIGSVTGGSAGGIAPDWADIVDLEKEVAVDNADIGRLAYITNPKVRGKLKAVYTNATYGEIPVWRDGPTPLNGYPAFVSNQVSSTLTAGDDSTCSAIFFGNWADLLIGLWGALDVLVDPYTASTTGTIRVVALQDADVAVRHAQSFAAMLNALTT